MTGVFSFLFFSFSLFCFVLLCFASLYSLIVEKVTLNRDGGQPATYVIIGHCIIIASTTFVFLESHWIYLNNPALGYDKQKHILDRTWRMPNYKVYNLLAHSCAVAPLNDFVQNDAKYSFKASTVPLPSTRRTTMQT